MTKLEKNNSQKKDLNELKEVSGGINDFNIDVSAQFDNSYQDNSKHISTGSIGGNATF